MGKPEERKPRGITTIVKFWLIRVMIGSSIAMFSKKIDSYLDRRYGPSNYDEKIVKVWNEIKDFF